MLKGINVNNAFLDESNILNIYRDKLDEQGVHQLERIKVNTQRMHALVLSLLDISRLNTKINPFITFSAGKVVEEVLSDLSLIIEKAGANIKTEKMPNVFGDKNQLENIFNPGERLKNIKTEGVENGQERMITS
ncbi:MAG: hypothetical protein K8S13_21925 [Desulfobacula sp.]|uniref:hypothetical protein n=1 Tax=Desulfobacula sp. TaxID=2593537 RepID=UPI0025BFBE99|nr:hypothetical protein [Desulfobacula sp.]MCD4722490.1 hypothetical protein [Desulfobacula sp.]